MGNRYLKKAKRGIGLYSYDEIKNTSSFQFLVQIVVGAVITSLGAMRFYLGLADGTARVHKHRVAETNFSFWLTTFVVLVIGVFIAHAGTIFYARRIFRGIFKRTRK